MKNDTASLARFLIHVIEPVKATQISLRLGQASITHRESGRLLSKRMSASLTFWIKSASVENKRLALEKGVRDAVQRTGADSPRTAGPFRAHFGWGINPG
jgi:hypothetical protein